LYWADSWRLSLPNRHWQAQSPCWCIKLAKWQAVPYIGNALKHHIMKSSIPTAKKRLQLNKTAIAKLAMTHNQLLLIGGGKRLAAMDSTIGGEPRCTSRVTTSIQECEAIVLELV
jgi:hypothetical protein